MRYPVRVSSWATSELQKSSGRRATSRRVRATTPSLQMQRINASKHYRARTMADQVTKKTFMPTSGDDQRLCPRDRRSNPSVGCRFVHRTSRKPPRWQLRAEKKRRSRHRFSACDRTAVRCLRSREPPQPAMRSGGRLSSTSISRIRSNSSASLKCSVILPRPRALLLISTFVP